MRHLKIYENFQGALLPNFDRLFASPEWQERFAILGVYPEYYKYHMKKMGPGTHERETEGNDTVIFVPARTDFGAEEDQLAPYQILLHIVRQARYRGSNEFWGRNAVPGFEVRRTEQPGMKIEGLRKETAGPVLLKGNDTDLARLENTIIQTYLEYLWQLSGQLSKAENVTKAAQLVSDVLVGKLDYEQAVQRVAKYLTQIAEPVDGDIYRMIKLVPPNYAKEMLIANGYTPQEADDLIMVDDYTNLF
jgi:hypothetical protein